MGILAILRWMNNETTDQLHQGSKILYVVRELRRKKLLALHTQIDCPIHLEKPSVEDPISLSLCTVSFGAFDQSPRTPIFTLLGIV